MKNSPAGRRSLMFRLCLSLAVLAWYLFLLAVLAATAMGWVAFRGGTREHLIRAARIDRLNPTYRYLLAKSYHLDLYEPSPDDAVRLYRDSLGISPLQPGVWLDLSKAYQARNDSQAAAHALERALSLSPTDSVLHWEAGVFWAVNGMQDKALEAFRKHLLLMPANQHAVYDLCWKFGIPAGAIQEKLVPHEYAYLSKYLLYLTATGRTDEAADVWPLLPIEQIERQVFLSYVNHLIASGRYDDAMKIWTDVTAHRETDGRRPAEQDSTSLVWNGGFERDMLNGGFDWVITEAAGVNVFLDEEIRMSGNRSLGVTFSGENPDAAFARQIILLRPGASYTLNAYLKTESITSSNGVLIRVSGVGPACQSLSQSSDSFTGTNRWREVSFEFSAPAGCQAALIQLRRDRSQKLDNRIEGTAWIDGITVRQQTRLLTQASEKR